MCNPRRLEVRLTREVTQSWSEEITRAAQASTTVDGEASVVLPLTQDFTDGLRAAFLAALGTDEQWIAVPDGYALDVAEGTARYDAATGELRLQFQLTDEVVVEVEQSQVLSDQRTARVAAEATELYRPWRSETEEAARRTATARVNQDLDRLEREREVSLQDQARRNVERQRAAAERALEQEATALAAARLREQADARREALREQAELRLERIRSAAMASINAAVLTAIRTTVGAFAVENNGQITRDEESDGILELELVWEDR
ncbi:hypothetical protein ACQP2E_20850 [Actinoplanes sp. CA-015351]|uniref:hypothetical protein n=1 Tax=Actinoplanes sp. CA-015351 TaxID=3239897 RepID=UPI003D99A95C